MVLESVDIATVAVFTVVFVLVIFYRKSQRPSGLPDGPPTLPFIGNLSLTWTRRFHLTLAELRQKYGPIFSLQLGWYPAVVISDGNLLREAFVEQANKFSNRPNDFLLNRLFGFNKGILNTDGDMWKGTRRLVITALRDLGMGTSRLESTVHMEAEALLAEIEKLRLEPINNDIIFSKASCNVICSMLFSERYDYDDPEFLEMLNKLSDFFREVKLISISKFVPYLVPLIFFEKQNYTAIKMFKNLEDNLKKKVEKHRQDFDERNKRDFVDVFLEAQKNNPDMKPSVEENLYITMIDLFIAGTESTNTTLKWGLIFMIRHPDIQDKCRALILQEIGKDRLPSFSDRENLPYVEATISEIQRLSNIAPHAIHHSTSVPVDFHGYNLPRQTVVIPDLYSVHMSEDHWEEATAFKPQRFLNQQGQYVRPPHFVPFSLGKRVCAGEQLAKMELFIFFTSLLQRFEFSCRDVSALPGVKDGICGVTLSPPTYEVIATPVDA